MRVCYFRLVGLSRVYREGSCIRRSMLLVLLAVARSSSGSVTVSTMTQYGAVQSLTRRSLSIYTQCGMSGAGLPRRFGKKSPRIDITMYPTLRGAIQVFRSLGGKCVRRCSIAYTWQAKRPRIPPAGITIRLTPSDTPGTVPLTGEFRSRGGQGVIGSERDSSFVARQGVSRGRKRL